MNKNGTKTWNTFKIKFTKENQKNKETFHKKQCKSESLQCKSSRIKIYYRRKKVKKKIKMMKFCKQ